MNRRQQGIWIAVLAGLILLGGCAGQMDQMKGEMRLQNEQYAEAIPLFQQALTANPDNCLARAKLGFALLKTGKIDPAIEEFQKVLVLRPGEPFATLYLGMAYASKEQIDKAIEVWKGYNNPGQPLLEAEIKRQLTLVQIAHSHNLAQQAMAQEAALGARPPEANTVAVCYFKDLTADKSLTAFQKGLAAMVIADLAKVKSFKVIERVQLQALLAEMRLGQTGIVDPATAPRVGRLLGAEKLMVGSLAKGSIQAAMTVASATRASVLGTTQISVPTEQFYMLPAGMIKAMADIAGVQLSSREMAAIGIAHTKNLKAFTYYGQALDALDAGNYQAARDFFALAIKEDPQFWLASEGLQGCPSADAPSGNALAGMTTAQLVSTVESAIDQAQAAQGEADAEASTADTGGGGGY